MAFEISDSKKEIAKEAEKYMLSCINILSNFKDHLNIIKDSFSTAEQISPEVLHKKRGVIDRYKRQVKENFEQKFRPEAIKAIKLFSFFDSDNEVEELNSAFEDLLQQIAKGLVKFFDLLDNLKDPQFKDNVLHQVHDILSKIEELDQLVRDRIIDFIDDHILVKHDFRHNEVELQGLKEPLLELLQEKNLMPMIGKREQSLNPADNQRVWTPTDIREVPEHDDVGRYNEKEM